MNCNFKMSSKSSLVVAVIASTLFFACEKRERIYYNWRYDGGNADVPAGQTAVFTGEDINGDLNANGGQVVFEAGGVVSGNLNLNPGGKVVLSVDDKKDQLFIAGDANLNDSLIIRGRGTTIINGNLNSNNNGVVYIENGANTDTTIVKGDLNSNNILYVKKGVLIVEGTLNVNKGKVSVENNATLVVVRQLNQSGTIYGYDNFVNKGGVQLNNPSQVFTKAEGK